MILNTREDSHPLLPRGHALILNHGDGVFLGGFQAFESQLLEVGVHGCIDSLPRDRLTGLNKPEVEVEVYATGQSQGYAYLYHLIVVSILFDHERVIA